MAATLRTQFNDLVKRHQACLHLYGVLHEMGFPAADEQASHTHVSWRAVDPTERRSVLYDRVPTITIEIRYHGTFSIGDRVYMDLASLRKEALSDLLTRLKECRPDLFSP